MNEPDSEASERPETNSVPPTDVSAGDGRSTISYGTGARPSNAETQSVPSGGGTLPFESETGDWVGSDEQHPPGLAETEHAIDPGAGERDTAAFEAGPETRSYHEEEYDRARTASMPERDPMGFELKEPRRERGPARMPNIPRYEILGELGRGGMGVVYKARDRKLDRYVALKMILAGGNAGPEDLERFENEAKAVAKIEHPNIVKVFDVGEHEGLPYFSLEFVTGGTLSRKIAGKPQDVKESARLVETLARAMQVAHKADVIHRDLKPANVLLTPEGTPKITDFGLAKRLEGDSSQTRSGSILGTPSYMAPEQAWGETKHVGPAADQYALGVILYELMTGRPPFQGASILETLEMVRSLEPVPPSRLQPKTPVDLETICLKCLEKDVSHRYADVGRLADDLRRYQNDEPIEARPVSDTERIYRWCRRNPRVAGLTAAVAALLLVVAGVSSAFAVTLSWKNTDLIEARNTADTKRKEAEASEKTAKAAARAANEQNAAAIDAQVRLLELTEDQFRYEPKFQAIRKELLPATLKNLEQTAAAMRAVKRDVGWDPANEQKNRRSLTRAHQRLGEYHVNAGQVGKAMEEFRLMDEQAVTLAADNPGDAGLLVRLARSKRLLGFLFIQRLGDSATALPLLNEAIEIDRKLLDRNPGDDASKLELANSLGMLAMAEMKLGHVKPQAQKLYSEEKKLRESISPATSATLIARRELSGLYEKMAEWYLRMNNPVKAKEFYEKSSAIRNKVLEEQPNYLPVVLDVARSNNNEAFLHYPQKDDPAAARELHARALKLLGPALAADPENVDVKLCLSETLYYEATCALKVGDTKAAEDGYRHCLELREAIAGDSADKMLQINLMVALARCGKHVEASRIAADLVANPPRDEQIYFQAACGYALSAAAAGGDLALAKTYTDAALECLRQGKARGWADVNSLKTDPDLEPIREHPDFQALIDEFSKPAKPAL